jgi:MFS transporter, DHA1 family, multidrug resistance protein
LRWARNLVQQQLNMNEEDRRMQADEREASPERWPTASKREEEVERPVSQAEKQETHEPLERQATASSVSSISSPMREDIRVSRMPTQRDDIADLERHPTALSRIQTGRSQHSNTIGAGIRSRTTTRQSKKPMPNFGGGKPFPPPLPEREEYVVEFDGPDDPLHAQNWPMKKKLTVAIVLGYVTLTAAFGSSIFSAATRSVSAVFNVSQEVSILGISLYVLGFATGPIL